MAGLNPYDQSGPWGTVIFRVSGKPKRVPGIIQSIDGYRTPEEWLIQKPINASNAITVWRGRNLAESMVLISNLYDKESFDDWRALRTALLPADPRKAPAIVYVLCPQLNMGGINRVGIRYVDPPKPAPQKSWTGELALIQYRPRRLAKVGPPDAPPADSAQTIENKKKAEKVNAIFAKIRERA